jgi:hypothetical protein
MDIDQAQFNFSPTLGLAIAVMVGLSGAAAVESGGR